MLDRTLGVDYSSGAQGADVSKIQTALQLAGFSPGPIDGIYGLRTKTAVQSFQSAHGLPIDGIVGPNTWSVLLTGTAPAGAQPATITIPRGKPANLPPLSQDPYLFKGLFGGLGNTASILSLGLGLVMFLGLKKKRRRR